MKSKPVALLLSALWVTKSHLRFYVSNDNPFSESQFKTMKYRPDFPNTFNSMVQAREFCRTFFRWYNQEYYHSGIGFLTPESMHNCFAEEILMKRQNVLLNAFRENSLPAGKRNKMPKPKIIHKSVWINKSENIKKMVK